MTKEEWEAAFSKVREAHDKAMEALAADVHPYSASAIRDWEQVMETALTLIESEVAPKCPDCGIPKIWCERVSSDKSHCWRWDYERFDEITTNLEFEVARLTEERDHYRSNADWTAQENAINGLKAKLARLERIEEAAQRYFDHPGVDEYRDDLDEALAAEERGFRE